MMKWTTRLSLRPARVRGRVQHLRPLLRRRLRLRLRPLLRLCLRPRPLLRPLRRLHLPPPARVWKMPMKPHCSPWRTSLPAARVPQVPMRTWI